MHDSAPAVPIRVLPALVQGDKLLIINVLWRALPAAIRGA